MQDRPSTSPASSAASRSTAAKLKTLIVAGTVLAMAGCGGGGGGAGAPASTGITGAETVLHSFAGGATDGDTPYYGNLVQASDGNFYGTTRNGGAAGGGTVFRMTPGGTVTVIHSFAGGTTDGLSPFSGLVLATDGNLYGMTSSGGTGGGTIFKITTTGTFTLLHSFAGGATDGTIPQSGLIQASDGNFYGTTSGGGTTNVGTVFKMTAAGTVTLLHSFGAAGDGLQPNGDLVQASDGNFYGMTIGGGAGNVGTIFKITPAGVESVLHSFSVGGTATDGVNPQGSLIQASDGNLYGMTWGGGPTNGGTVFKITLAGTESILHFFTSSTTDGGGPNGSLIQASDGNLYGLTAGGGASPSGFGTVFKITTGGTFTLLHSFMGGTADGATPMGNLMQASDGKLYGMTSAGGASNLGIAFRID